MLRMCSFMLLLYSCSIFIILPAERYISNLADLTVKENLTGVYRPFRVVIIAIILVEVRTFH